MCVDIRECVLFRELVFDVSGSDIDDHRSASFFLATRASIAILSVATFEGSFMMRCKNFISFCDVHVCYSN